MLLDYTQGEKQKENLNDTKVFSLSNWKNTSGDHSDGEEWQAAGFWRGKDRL